MPKVRSATTTPARSSRQRWGGGQNADPDTARARIIAAARACYAERAIARTTVADIAQRAQIGRATLYRYFPSQEAVLLAVFQEEVRGFLAQFRGRVPADTAFAEQLLALMVFTVQNALSTPMHRELFSEESGLWVSRHYLHDAVSLGLTAGLLRESFQVARRLGEIHDDLDLDEVVAFAARLLVSFMLVPDAQRTSDAQLRRYFEQHLIRALRKEPPGRVVSRKASR